MSDPHDQLSADYNQTTSLIATLTDVRFKLLAFVPTISGAAIAVIGNRHSTAELLAVGLLGLTATLGIVFYELRNTQLYDYAVHRAKKLEQRLQFVSISDDTKRAGCSASARTEASASSASRRWGTTAAWHSSTAPRSAAGATSSRGERCARSASGRRRRLAA